MAFRFPPAVKLGCFGGKNLPPPPSRGKGLDATKRSSSRGGSFVGGWGVQWGFVSQKPDDDHHTRMYGFRFFVVVGILYSTDLDLSSFSRIANNGLYCNQVFFWGFGMLIRRPRCQWTGWLYVLFIGLRATVAWWKIPMYECESPCIVWKCFF